MINRNIVTALMVTFVITFCGINFAFAQEFSADMVSKTGKETMAAKIFVAEKKTRMEMPENIVITRMDKNVSYIVMPSQNMYMEHPISTKMVPKTTEKFDGEIERQSLGKETVEGQSAEKFKVTYTESGKKESVYQWLVNGIVPVKIEAVDGSWSVVYKNLKIGKQPADLFEPPAGYEKMSMPSMGDMMKGMMGN